MILSLSAAQTQFLGLCFMLWRICLPQTRFATLHGVAIYLTHVACIISRQFICLPGFLRLQAHDMPNLRM